MTAMPLMIGVLCVMAIAYRFYSKFLAVRVAGLDDSQVTPAVRLEDGQNYHPTSKWVLFGHHFAAISGAGPLIGPVLAAQFGYMPGLLWILIGVCLAGAVQDFLVLSMSIRRNGKSLAQIAFTEINQTAGWAASLAILFIIIIALAGLGKVVVNALGGESVGYPNGTVLCCTAPLAEPAALGEKGFVYRVPAKTYLLRLTDPNYAVPVEEAFDIVSKTKLSPISSRIDENGTTLVGNLADGKTFISKIGSMSNPGEFQLFPLPDGSARVLPGSSWGTFTIACTIPIALFVGLYMYRIRKGRTVEASLIGGALTIGATVLGAWVSTHAIGHYFNLTQAGVIWAMGIYGFVAAVLPVWVLLAPRDYLSSFLKIGTIALLVFGVILANPEMKAPAVNHIFLKGGPTVGGQIFPFLFITIMCGAISGFHALVSSGTTPKMIIRESHARTIGYGAMLIEGLVGVVSMIAASTLDPGDYYAMNTQLAVAPQFHDQFVQIGANVDHLNVYEERTQESLRGRTGGAVTLAVGMAHIFDQASQRFFGGLGAMWKYWYHFAIMFEALFILTTIDAGTRIGRFLLQEFAGKVIHPKLADQGWWPGAIVSTGIIVLGWCYLINFNSFSAIWAMFGVANQLLAVIALSVVGCYLVRSGKSRYLWVTALPMILVLTTTTTAAVEIFMRMINTIGAQQAIVGNSDAATEAGKKAIALARTMIFNSRVTATLLGLIMVLGWTVVVLAAWKMVTLRPRAPQALPGTRSPM